MMSMTRKQAMSELSKTGNLTTDMLKPLGIRFESFLGFAQLPEENAREIILKLVGHFTGNK
jgi:hypothetical protein